MKKNIKIAIGIVLGLGVVLGAFAMSKVNDSDLMGASILQVSGISCRKVSNALYRGDLYTDILAEMGMDWEKVAKCGKRYPSLFKKSLKWTANEDRCSMLRDWLDEGVLSATYSSLRIKNEVLSQCAQQFRDIWFDEESPVIQENETASWETCQLLKQWRSQGVLTPTMQSRGMAWSLVADCSNAYPGIFQGGTNTGDNPTMRADCQTLRNWLDATSLSPVKGPLPASLSIVQTCARDYAGIWNNTRRSQGNDYATVSKNNCQLYQNWISTGTLTPNLQALGLSLTIQITQCRAQFPEVMGVKPSVAGATCENVAQWVKQRTSTANLQSLGLDIRSTITNCGNTCLYKMPKANYEKCDNMALWLNQGTLTPNLQSKGMSWDQLTDCGYFCMFNY